MRSKRYLSDDYDFDIPTPGFNNHPINPVSDWQEVGSRYLTHARIQLLRAWEDIEANHKYFLVQYIPEDPIIVRQTLSRILRSRVTILTPETHIARMEMNHMILNNSMSLRDNLIRRIGTSTPDLDKTYIEFLGGVDVGRSAYLIHVGRLKILIDSGMDFMGTNPYPEYPEYDSFYGDLDYIILTHAHSDHCLAIPGLLRMNPDLIILGTEPTRDLAVHLMEDSIRLANRRKSTHHFNQTHVDLFVRNYIQVDLKIPLSLAKGVTITLYPSGHILGSVGILFEVGTRKTLFTSDYKLTPSYTLKGAEYVSLGRLNTIVTEGTYLGKEKKESSDDPRGRILEILRDGGKVYFSTFSVGRSQEVLIYLTELLGELSGLNVPIFVEGSISEICKYYYHYREYLRPALVNTDGLYGMFPALKHTQGMVSSDLAMAPGSPAIYLSPSGMLTGGPIYTLLTDRPTVSRDMLLFTGYQAPGTPGDALLNGNPGPFAVQNLEVSRMDQFSGHCDESQITKLINRFTKNPIDNIIFMHTNKLGAMNYIRNIKRRARRIVLPRLGEKLRL